MQIFFLTLPQLWSTQENGKPIISERNFNYGKSPSKSYIF